MAAAREEAVTQTAWSDTGQFPAVFVPMESVLLRAGPENRPIRIHVLKKSRNGI